MDLNMENSRTYHLGTASVQNVAYALSEYLDAKKNMITQTMRTKNGYTVQCKGDANMEWTRYIGLDVALDINLTPMDGDLVVEIVPGRWMEKLGIAVVGSIFFQPLLVTSGIGVIRQMAIPQDVFRFIGEYLGTEPVEEVTRTVSEVKNGRICPVCGHENREDAKFCSECGAKFEPVQEVKTVVCPKCGKELTDGEKFCTECGEKIGE